jgi:hypothetical protein
MHSLNPSLFVVMAALVVSPARADNDSYALVRMDGTEILATGLVLTPNGFKGSTTTSVFELDASQVDFYRTFLENVQSGASNVIVFKTGALLRFDRFAVEDGTLHLNVAGGGQLDLAEGLVDYRASVEQGAMVKLPAGAGSSIAISPSQSGGAAVPDAGAANDAPDELLPPGVKRRGSLLNRRRAGQVDRLPSADESQDVPEPQDSQDVGAADDPVVNEPPAMPPENPDPVGGVSPPPASGGRSRPPFGSRAGGGLTTGTRGGEPGGNQGGETTGQAIVSISTDYQGPIAGLKITVGYPTNLQLIEPVQFTGFAAGFLTQPNPLQPGQLIIGGASAEEVNAAGGELLRLAFVWSGSAPDRGMFRVNLEAVRASGERITSFNWTSDVQIN